jgi:hypothetical protein
LKPFQNRLDGPRTLIRQGQMVVSAISKFLVLSPDTPRVSRLAPFFQKRRKIIVVFD